METNTAKNPTFTLELSEADMVHIHEALYIYKEHMVKTLGVWSDHPRNSNLRTRIENLSND